MVHLSEGRGARSGAQPNLEHQPLGYGLKNMSAVAVLPALVTHCLEGVAPGAAHVDLEAKPQTLNLNTS